MAYNFHIPNLRKLLTAVFSPISGHDHDGINSKAVTTGTPAAGALSANTSGRAIIAKNFFNAATVADKFANDSITDAVVEVKIADAAFKANADARGKFEDGIWTRDKLADDALSNILMVPVEPQAAGDDIVSRAVFEVPADFAVEIISADIISQGTPSGIDDSNTCVVAISRDSDGAIVSKTFNTGTAFPANGVVVNLGTPEEDYKELEAGKKIVLSVTNGATAVSPRFAIRLVYKLATA